VAGEKHLIHLQLTVPTVVVRISGITIVSYLSIKGAEMKRIYIDTETTGKDPKKHGVVQIAGLVELPDLPMGEFNFMTKPFPLDEIDEEALEVHGHSFGQLQGFPDPKNTHSAFTNFLGGYIDKFNRIDKFIVIGYNVRFDIDFLREWFIKCGDQYFGSWFRFPPIDVMNLAAYIIAERDEGQPDNYKLETIANHFGFDTSTIDLHDAMADIRLTKDLFDKFRDWLPVVDSYLQEALDKTETVKEP